MQLLSKLIFAISIVYLSVYSVNAQSLGSPADYNISPQDSSTNRSVSVDIHKATGKVVYIWNDLDSVGTTRDIYCAIYKNDMTLIQSRFRINHNSANEQIYAKLKINQQDSTFIVTWSSNHSGSNYDIYMKKISLNTASTNYTTIKNSSDILVNNSQTGDQNVSMLAIDYFKNELIVGFRDQNGLDGSLTGAFARRFNYSTLSSIKNQFQINNYSTGYQHLCYIDVSPVTGELITLCQSYSAAETGNYNIIKRIFNYNSTSDSYVGQSETVVNSYTNGGQSNAWMVINNTTGHYVIGWTDDTQDGSGYGVYAKIYNSSHSQTIADFQVSNQTLNNQLTERPVWDVFTNNIIFFNHYSVSGLSTIRYRIFTYNDYLNTLTAVGNEAGALIVSSVETNTYNYYSANFCTVYNPENHKIYIAYDRYRYSPSYNSTLSNAKARVFTYTHPSIIYPVTDYISYAELKTDLDGGYYTSIGNKFYFKYVEKYNQGTGTSLNYKIYDYKRNVLSSASLNKVYGVNYYSIDLRGVASLSTGNQNFYTLEVFNDKAERKVLRFKYIPEY
jgi:hypothetical protein